MQCLTGSWMRFGFWVFLLFFCFLLMKKRKQCARCVNETPTKEKLTRLRLWNCNKRTKKHTCSCVAPGRQERVKNVGVTNLPPHAHKPHTNQSDTIICFSHTPRPDSVSTVDSSVSSEHLQRRKVSVCDVFVYLASNNPRVTRASLWKHAVGMPPFFVLCLETFCLVYNGLYGPFIFC